MATQKVRLTLLRSISGRLPKHIATVTALGLKRLHQVIEVNDSSALRGMLKKVSYLLKVEEI